MRLRSLWPREHGAYVQLLAPIAAALAAQLPESPAAPALAVAAMLAFVAHEPFAVISGSRGERRKQQDGARAVRRFCGLSFLGLSLALVGFVLAPRALPIAGCVAVPALATGVLANRRAVHAASGEIVAATALAGAGAVVGTAAGMAYETALWIWLAWSIGYSATVVAVHRVLDNHRRSKLRLSRSARDGIAIAGLFAVAVAIVFVARVLPPLWIAEPLVVASALVVATGRARLQTVGIVLAVISAGCAVLAVMTA
jgi:hypothetical protein